MNFVFQVCLLQLFFLSIFFVTAKKASGHVCVGKTFQHAFKTEIWIPIKHFPVFICPAMSWQFVQDVTLPSPYESWARLQQSPGTQSSLPSGTENKWFTPSSKNAEFYLSARSDVATLKKKKKIKVPVEFVESLTQRCCLGFQMLLGLHTRTAKD